MCRARSPSSNTGLTWRRSLPVQMGCCVYSPKRGLDPLGRCHRIIKNSFSIIRRFIHTTCKRSDACIWLLRTQGKVARKIRTHPGQPQLTCLVSEATLQASRGPRGAIRKHILVVSCSSCPTHIPELVSRACGKCLQTFNFFGKTRTERL